MFIAFLNSFAQDSFDTVLNAGCQLTIGKVCAKPFLERRVWRALRDWKSVPDGDLLTQRAVTVGELAAFRRIFAPDSLFQPRQREETKS